MVNSKILLVLLFCLSSFAFSQEEKRLALVIGNAEYIKGELNNPVNDANLMANTLDSLGFEVLLKTNLKQRADLYGAIREFGEKREDYSVGLVYYAGHGIQVDDQNYILPTHEEFNSENDVIDFGVSVQLIMRYLKNRSNEVNILILDACRDNPFESSWAKTRSIASRGLAKIPPPTGSLIAFSTDSGQTAPDGEGENSLYTLSLAKNMMLEQTSIDQVFRNVRSEVFQKTNGEQRPVEATQLTGKEFYLNPKEFTSLFQQVDDFILSENNDDDYTGLSIVENIINNSKDVNDIKKAMLYKARLYMALGQLDEVESLFKTLLNDDPYNDVALAYYGLHNFLIKEYKTAIEYYSKAIELDPQYAKYFYGRAVPYEELQMYTEAEADYLKAIELDPNQEDYYLDLGNLYKDGLNDPEKAIAQYTRILEFKPTRGYVYNNIGLVYEQKLENIDKAEEYYLKAIKVDSLFSKSYRNLADLNVEKEEYLKAIEYYSKAIELDPKESVFYYLRTTPYEELEMYAEAEADYLKAIELNPKDEDYYLAFGNLYKDGLNDYEKGIAQYLKILDLNPNSVVTLTNIGLTYLYDLENSIKAKEYFFKAIKVDSTYSRPYVSLAYISENKKEYKAAIEYYSKAIELAPQTAEYYYYRTTPYEELEMYAEAEADYLKAIELDPNQEGYYLNLGNLYKDDLNDPEKAIAQYIKTLDLIPNSGVTLTNIGLTYQYDLENSIKAKEYFFKAIKMDSTYSKPYIFLAYISENKKEYKAAIEYYSKAIELAPQTAEYYAGRSTPYEELEMYAEAEADYLKAIELNPNKEAYYAYLSSLYLDNMNEPEKAIAQYLKIIEFNPEDPFAYNNLGLIYETNLKNLEKAQEYYFKAIKIDTLYSLGYSNLGNITVQKKDYLKAIEYYSKAIELDPKKDWYYYSRTTPYKELEMYAEAEADYLKAIGLDSTYRDYYYSLGRLYENKLKNPTKAKFQFEKIISLLKAELDNNDLSSKSKSELNYKIANLYFEELNNPNKSLEYLNLSISLNNNSDALVLRGTIFQINKQFIDAEKDFKDAITLNSDDRNNYFYLSNLYLKTGNFDKAREIINETINKDAKDPDGYFKLAYTYYLESNYFSALEYSTIAIVKAIDNKVLLNDVYYISDINNKDRINLEDLYLFRFEIKKNLNLDSGSLCLDLKNAHQVAKSKKVIDKINGLISETCN